MISDEINLAEFSFKELHQIAQDSDNGTSANGKNQIKTYIIYDYLANNGDPLAQYYLGLLYLNNIFTPLYHQDHGTASILPQIVALFTENYCLDETITLNLIFDKIFKSDQTRSPSIFKFLELDIEFILQRIFKYNLYYAQKFFTLSADNGNVDALFALGEIYLNASFGMLDHAKAKKFFIEAATKGHILAKCRLGEIYEYYEANPSEALVLYQAAADEGCAAAMFNLAFRYDVGFGVEENRELATLMLIRAADLAYPAAQYVLSDRYIIGDQVKPNLSKALNLCLNAATQGYPPAQNIIGLRLSKGEGLKLDPYKAVEWFRRAATNSYKDALFNLGSIYYFGCGEIKVNLDQAIKYYKKAALKGHIGAKQNLEIIYDLLFHEVSMYPNQDACLSRLGKIYIEQKIFWAPSAQEKVHFSILKNNIAKDRKIFVESYKITDYFQAKEYTHLYTTHKKEKLPSQPNQLSSKLKPKF